MSQQTHDAPAQTEDASQPFVGRWNRLVSTTNWEKGRIIHQWRTAMIAADAPAAEYADEAWSVKVGGVTGQHVGRLRRVYDRFGAVYEQYDGLYWSHFQIALDWEDAEMWLEGALQNGWSVAQMRHHRRETLATVQGQQPDSEPIVTSETDEDFQPVAEDSPPGQRDAGQPHGASRAASNSTPQADGKAGDGSSDSTSSAPATESDRASNHAPLQQPSIAFVRPFEHLGELPPDVNEAFESYKLAILRHKSAGWQEISLEETLASLDALKELAVAPSAEPAI